MSRQSGDVAEVKWEQEQQSGAGPGFLDFVNHFWTSALLPLSGQRISFG